MTRGCDYAKVSLPPARTHGNEKERCARVSRPRAQLDRRSPAGMGDLRSGEAAGSGDPRLALDPPFRQARELAECQKGWESSVFSARHPSPPARWNWWTGSYFPRNTHILAIGQRHLAGRALVEFGGLIALRLHVLHTHTHAHPESGGFVALRLRVLHTHASTPGNEGRLSRGNPAVSVWAICQFSPGRLFRSQ